MKNRIFFALIFIVSFLSQTLSAQVVINEICPSNISVIQNSNGKFDDWLELYNAGSSAVNLNGYGLSIDPLKPYRFAFPSYQLAAGGRILVFASDSNSSVISNHWETAVNATSTWKYFIGSSALDTNWRNTTFSDASWSSGTGGIGFADGDDGTTIPVSVSVMMRKTFTIPDTSQILKAVFMMDYDDGFVAYLNGVEIARNNLGSIGTRPAWNDLALSSHEAQMYQGLPADSFFIDPLFLKSVIRQGSNVLTVETHNVPANSNDLTSNPYLFFGMKNSGMTFSALPSWFHAPSAEYYNAHFKLSRNGATIYLTNPSGTTVDQKTYLPIGVDNSNGRKPDGSASWCYFNVPTPNASNNASVCYSGYASIPLFSISAGFYPTTRTLTLSTTVPGGIIRYTKNGDEPKTTSPAYSSAISITHTTTIRARVFASGMLPSPIVTNTYFINENIKLPIFTITTDSLNLWDYNTGIYVLGPNAGATYPYFGANFWQDWQKPATVEYYDKDKNRILRFDGEINIYGNYSRAQPQKSTEIKLSDRYGTSSVSYPFFSDKPFITTMDDIVLRNSGTDWNVVHFRDGLMERLMRKTYLGYLAYEPAVMFLNGAFWGVYTIQENHDENWMGYNYGLGKNQIDYLKEKGSVISIRDGSDSSFWNMYNYATSQTPTTQAYYDHMNSVLDLQNYTDYFICETYYNNGDWIGDWTNNIMMWRPSTAGSKWKYFLYDLDFGLGLQGSVNDNRLSIARNPVAFSYSSNMFDAILNNPTYKRYFINRYADLINTIYLPSNVDAFQHQFQDSMAFDMPAHFAKWGSNMTTWHNNITAMMNFATARPNIMRNFIQSGFSMTSQVTLTLNVSPAGAGRIEISTITPPSYPWSGVYFNGNPVTITAIPNPGYTFDHFHSNVAITTNNPNQSVTYNFTANDVVTAYFTGSSSPTRLTVSEFNYHSDSVLNAGDWVELHNYGTQAVNLSGWKLSDGADNHMFRFPTGTTIAAGAYLVISEDTVKFRTQFPTITNKIGLLGFNLSNAGDEIRLFDYRDSLYLSFIYQDLAPWPLGADGGGYTCELLSQTGNLNDGNNWFPGCIGGSPGRAYSPALAIPVSVTGSTTFCSGGSALLTATNDSGYVFQWKKNNVNILGATTATYTANLAGSYTVSVTYSGCSVVSAPTIITVVAQQPDPVTTPAFRCGSGTLTLSATASDSVFWYDAPGGNLVGSGNTFQTPSLTSSTTYYARTGRTTCASNPVSALAQILTQTSAPVTSDVTRCGPGTATLTASDTAVMHWYPYASGGAVIGTGPTFTTNIVSSDTLFYVEAGTVCPSPRIEAHVIITTTPEPTVSDTFRCGNGTLTLIASSPSPVSWYNRATGGTALGTGYTFTTPFETVSDTFYVEANAGCASERIPVIAIVYHILSPPVSISDTSCGPGSMNLSATSSEQVYWYDSPTGGNLLYTGANFITPSLTTSVTYYTEAGYHCRSSRTAVQAIVDSVPPAPVATDTSRCGTGILTLSANSAEMVSWFDAAIGGNLLGTGDTYITPSISSTTTYYAEAGTACRSLTRTAVHAIVNPMPSPPVTSNVTRCSPGTINISASATGDIYWYNASTGGTVLDTGNIFTTPFLSSTTTYYLETGIGCRSSRVAVQAIIGTPAAPPTSANVSRCGPGTVTLTATSPEQVYWYSSATGGTLLATSSSYSTPLISTSTTYYAEAGNTCRSLTRTAAQAIVNSIPAPPSTSNVLSCDTGTVTLTATSPQQVYWYSAASGGTPLDSGSTFITPSLTATTTYYTEAGGQCRSSRISVQAVVGTPAAPPTGSNVSRCGPGTVTLTASSTQQIYWYSAATGGTLLATSSLYSTPLIGATTTYYAEAGDVCRSLTRTAIQAVIIPPPSPPVTANVSRCGSGIVTLTATSPEQVYWYSAATGGTLLATSSNYTTPSISTTTTYFTEAGNTCRSSRISVQAIVNAIPSAPTSSNVSRCGPGTVALTATSPQQVYWYDAATGGNLLATSSNYSTPLISATTTYFAEAGNTCRSLARTAVQAIINAIPAPPSGSNVSRCGTGTVTLTASSPEQIYWFSAATGGTLLATSSNYTTPSIATTTTYYAEDGNTCRSLTRTAIQAVINALPAPPVTTNVIRCGPGTVALTATSPEQIYWYSAATGGTLLDSGITYNTPSITATTTYYLETGNSCRSSRVSVQAIINSQAAPPTASNSSRCGPGTVALSASSPQQVYWYDAATGGSLLATSSNYTTPSITTTTTYYAEAGNGTCHSLTRTAVQAIVNSIPGPPTGSNVSRCGPGTVALTAASPEQVYWYSAATGGTLLATSSNYTTPSISTTTTYYAEDGNTCRSLTRTAIQAVINALPAPPVATDVTRCSSGTVTLTATSPEQIYWYSAATGGTLLATASSYTTPVISTTTTYYTEAGNTCRSNRIAVQAIISAPAAAPTASNTSRCGTGTVTLTASSPQQVYWYDAPSGGTLLATSSNYTTPIISVSSTYYAEAGNTCRSLTRTAVQAIVNAIPAAPSGSNVSRCGTGTLTLTASALEQIYWYSAATGGTLLATSSNYTTPSISTTTTYYAEDGNTCRSLIRTAIQAVINPIPAAPVSSDVSRCGPGTVTLTATHPEQIYWYSAPTGGTLLATSSTYTTPPILFTTTYYTEAGNTCRSNRIAVLAIIDSTPTPPVVSNISRCGPGSVMLTATASVQVNWYYTASGGSPAGTGPTFNTPLISVNTTYYADAGLGCNSARVPVQAIINAVPAPPSTSGDSMCGPGVLTLSASSPDSILWFTVPTGGSPVGIGSTFTTPLLPATTVYYAAARNLCESARIPVDAIIINFAAAPVVFNSSNCGPGLLTLSASSPDSITWYSQASGGIVLGTGTTFTTPLLINSATYYAVAGTMCPSAAVPVFAAIYAQPVVNLGPDTLDAQSGQPVQLDAGSGYTQYMWSTGDSTQTITVSASGFYEVAVTDSNQCSGSDIIFINFTTSIYEADPGLSLQAYPNPASGAVLVSWKSSRPGTMHLHLFSIEGRLLMMRESKGNHGLYSETISVNDLAAGVYLLQLDRNESAVTIRLVVQP